jgi:ABC-type dipeptide/oligopeptide/nickel transport system permease component
VVAAVVLLAAVFIVVMNTLVDIVYAFLDPRVRLA